MENRRYQLRQKRSEAMLNAGIEPILDGSEFFIPSQNAGINQKAEWKELLTKALQQPIVTSRNLTAKD